jgi:hypothetical protein
MERGGSDRSWRRIDDPRAAQVLVDFEQLHFLKPFLGREATVSRAAQELGVHEDAMYYRVRRLVDLGILSVVRAMPRAGKAIKVYSVVADGLYVPFSATPADTMCTLIYQMDLPLERRLTDGIVDALWETIDPNSWGLRIFSDAGGRTRLSYGPEDAPADWDMLAAVVEPTFPAVLFDWCDLRLTREDAKDLQHRLLELQREFHAKAEARDPAAPARSYLVRLAMTPLEASAP